MQWFFIIGSVVALIAAVAFLVVGFVAALKSIKSNANYVLIWFAVSMLLLALFLLQWHVAFGRVVNETQSFVAATPGTGPGQWGQILLAGIGGAFLTLGWQVLISWLKRPKISIIFEDGGVGYGRDGPDPKGSYWVRVKVTNSGETVAKSCIGKISQFKHDRNVIDRDPIRLHWIDTPWQQGSQLFDKIDLHPGQSEFLDVILTISPYPSPAYLFTGLKFQIRQEGGLSLVEATARTEKLPEHTNRIRIEVYGDNFEFVPEEYTIAYGSTHNAIRLEKL